MKVSNKNPSGRLAGGMSPHAQKPAANPRIGPKAGPSPSPRTQSGVVRTGGSKRGC